MAEQKEKYPKKVNGGTIIDYVAWRGDLTFEHSPWGEIDSVIAAMIAYANLGENELSFGSGRTVRLGDIADSDLLERYPQEGIGDGAKTRGRFLEALARSRRFQDIIVLDQVNDVDAGRNIQFSAMTLDVPGVGTVVAFRGTNPSLVGWKEDFMMSYTTPVPAQTASLAYLKKAAENTAGPLYLTGHSKGGNLALYSAAHADRDVQARLIRIYSFDGPGLDDETIVSEGYRRIEPLIQSDVPSGSIVGMLMNYHPRYRVVQSASFSILQHDPFNWKLVGRRFLEAESVSNSSQILDQAVHEWLKSCTVEQREIFVTVIFSLLSKKKSAKGQAEADGLMKKVDEESGKMIRTLINRLIGLYAGISWDRNVLKPLMQASDDLRLRLKGLQGDPVKSSVIRIDNHGNGFREAADETMRMADEGGLRREERLRLVVIAEEIMSMVNTVSGEMEAQFWIERAGRHYQLHVSTRPLPDKKQRRRIKQEIASKIGDRPAGFLARLRGAFEHAMVSDTDRVCFSLSAGGGRDAPGQWDGCERSVLFRLADDTRITTIGGEVRMTVSKEFAEQL